MIELDSIVVEDFGPFKNNQEISFPNEPGVTIIWGENMRGKTSLLNAIRYALFGTILGRGSREMSPEQFINWESKSEGKYSFKVVLNFFNNDNQYELTREYKPRAGVTDPVSDEDYTDEVFLRKNGDILGPEERESELAQVMPEKISRFFLFDGELLQQYEELLIDESEMGRRIRDAIERILGLPVLTNGRADLRQLLDEAERKESSAAQKSKKTQEIGTQLENLTERRVHFQEELGELEDDLETLKDRRSAIKEKLERLDAVRGLVQEQNQLEGAIEEIEEELEEREEHLRDLMSNSWQGLLYERINEELEELRERAQELESRRTKHSISKQLSSRLQEGLEDGNCPICSQELGEDSHDHIQKEIESLQSSEGFDDDAEEEYRSVISSIQVLEEMEEPSPEERIKDAISEIEHLRADKAEKRDRIDEIDEQIAASEEEEVKRLDREYDKIVGQISIKEEAIEETEEELDDIEQNIQKLQRQLDSIGGTELEKERQRRELYNKLYNLFDQAIDKYRDDLRDRVESDSSRIFQNLTTEPDYSGLKINDNYGLTIVHEDGEDIPVRSAGAEHVVALSLMGALQNNAPLQGPIIMDSPFGRLDEGHMENTVEALPEFTDQVVLLVYRGELEPTLARELLQGKLRKEYSMARRSARHTELVPGGEPN